MQEPKNQTFSLCKPFISVKRLYFFVRDFLYNLKKCCFYSSSSIVYLPTKYSDIFSVGSRIDSKPRVVFGIYNKSLEGTM